MGPIVRYALLVLSIAYASHSGNAATFTADWRGTGPWPGPDFWSTPMYDWPVSSGSITAPAAVNRTLSVLTSSLANTGASATISAKLSFSGSAITGSDSIPERFATGFSIGRQGYVSDYRSAAVLAKSSIFASIRADGRLQILNEKSIKTVSFRGGPLVLTLNIIRIKRRARLSLTAVQGVKTVSVTSTVPLNRVTGGVALEMDGEIKGGARPTLVFVTFKDFSMVGPMVNNQPDRAFGPILWTQYMISDDSLRIQAQLAPLEQRYSVTLYLKYSNGWSLAGNAKSDSLSRTALFRIPNWNGGQTREYQVRIRYMGKIYRWGGTIRSIPTASKFKLAVFSCDEGYLFPMNDVVSQVNRQNPDMLAFVGDQIYDEPAGFDPESNIEPARFASIKVAMLDYLHKWYRFGWTWREVISNRPSIMMPDDHDVYQGNLFGAGGVRLPDRSELIWSLGGYIMPGRWVTGIEKTHVGHLPSPAVDITLPIGIKPYFTDIRYGDIGIAVLEDRKFKTGPQMLDPRLRSAGDGAELLGPAQENFVRNWCRDWKNVTMKIAISATIFSKATTHVGRELRRGRYSQDSGAWPRSARNRAVRMLGDANVLTIHGDQHLGVLLRQGIDDFDDAGYSFMVPGIANGFPRAWWPGVESRPAPGDKFTGRFVDDAGHPINVLAVGNPDGSSIDLNWWTSPPDEVAYRKGSGYGLVILDKSDMTAEFNLYRVGRGEQQFAGFPHSVKLGGARS